MSVSLSLTRGGCRLPVKTPTALAIAASGVSSSAAAQDEVVWPLLLLPFFPTLHRGCWSPVLALVC